MSDDGTGGATWRESRKRLLPATVAGSVIEWYDIAIFSQAAALVFPTLFFGALDRPTAILATFATFGAGHAVRPIGAVLFGHLGDRYGRKFALVATLLLAGITTTAIGLLPTFEAIGVAAPVLLVVLRLLQGLGVGAEYAGAVTLVAEHAPRRRRGFFCALPSCGVIIGLALGAAAGALAFSLSEQERPGWSWRVPFLASVVIMAVGIFLRLRVQESPVFTLLTERAKLRRPVVAALRNEPRRVGFAAVANSSSTFNTYVVQTFSLAYLADLHVKPTTSLTGLLLGCLAGIVLIPITGSISDRFGRRPVYAVCLIAVILTPFPFFWLLNTGQTALIWIAMIVALGSVFSVLGPQGAFFSEQFDTQYRYSAYAFSREIGALLLAAPAPTIAAALTMQAGGRPWLVAGVMSVVGIASLLAVAALPETRGRDLAAPVRSVGDGRQAGGGVRGGSPGRGQG